MLSGKYLPDWFITGLLFMIVAAWLVPGIGMTETLVNLGNVIDAGVILIFFFYGLKLDPEKLRRGMSNWRMHLAVQSTTFIIFPLLILPFYPIFRDTPREIFWTGMFFLAALPSTVSSSVVMVSIAGGNIPGAIFNASISGIIGIIMTPFWMGLFLTSQSAGFEFGHVIVQLVTQIIMPVAAGLLLHQYFVRWVTRHLPKLAMFDKIIILLIVYESFSHSFMAGIFSQVSWLALILLCVAVIILFFVVMYLTRLMAKLLKFKREDMITLVFAGSKKSLVHGSVFASVLFAGISGAGIYLLPIMIYHAFQLFYISVVARRMALATIL
ncbi:MAG: bile acid:sodium symporter family protein [Bacteroidota bacterium]